MRLVVSNFARRSLTLHPLSQAWLNGEGLELPVKVRYTSFLDS